MQDTRCAGLLALTLAFVALQGCDRGSQATGGRGRSGQALGSSEPRIVKTADGLDAVEGELLVRFKDGVTASSAAQVHTVLQADVVHRYRSLPGLQLVRLPEGKTLEEASQAYLAEPGVLYAEPNYVYRIDATPNDPQLGELWGLHNTGQDGGVVDADINAPEAWDLSTGSDQVTVAIIDTGVNYEHEDLSDNIWVNPGEVAGNNVDDDGNGYVDDVHGINAITNTGDPMDDNHHGSHCSGTIAGRGNNGVGVAGVNWNARIVGCKFLSSAGSGSTANAVKCLDYLYDLKTRATDPVDIVLSSNSWGGGSFSQALLDGIVKHREAGILFVAAAGNSNANNDVTANYPSNYNSTNILAVAATDRFDAKASFSSYGRRTVHVGAPGVDILSTTLGDTYSYLSGTSMATPHVSGLTALLKAQDPSRDWKALKNLVISGGTDTPAMTGITISGKRIRAADLGGVGSLTCSDRVVNSRLLPSATDLQVLTGSLIGFSVLHINCANPNGNVVVSISPGGGTFTLTDTGAGLDQVAGDGIYSAEWSPTSAGTYTLTFPNGDVITVTAMDTYRPALTPPAEWRTIAGTPLNVGDDTLHTVTPPFPVRFGNHAGFTTAYISSNGYLSFNTARSTNANATLPNTNFQTLVAPFWDNLYTASTAPVVGDVYTEVLGTAPNREWVVEWRNMGQFSLRTTAPSATITFQVVFQENSAEVKFNYLDVDFQTGTGTYDRGGSATVGVQVNSTNATRFSSNTRALTNDSTLQFRVNAPPVLAAVSVSPTSFLEGGSATFNSTFSDADGAADADWTSEWDFAYDGTTFTIDASQTHTAEGAISFSRGFPQSGRYLVGVRLKDKDGGPSTVRTITVTVDNVVPVAVAATAAPVAPREGEAVTFTGAFSDVGTADNPWRVEWDFDYDGATFTVDRTQSVSVQGSISTQYTYDEDGTYTVALRVVDRDSGVSALVTSTVVVADVSPTISVATGLPASGGEPRTVSFEVVAASGSPTPASDPVRYYLWDFDGDGEADTISSEPRALHRYLDNPAGGDTYNVTVWAEDEDSRTARTVPVVVANVAPSLAALPPAASAAEGVPFQLQVSASDPGGAQDPLSFDLSGAPEGMGITAAGLIRWTPTFAQSGRGAGRSYSVTVQVRDDDGATASGTFTVSSAWKDADSDGMADTWEDANGLDSGTNDAAGDKDGDGVSNLDEFNHANGGPFTAGKVMPDGPLALAQVRTNDVTLRVNNTTDPDSTGLTYVFELYADEAMTTLIKSASSAEDASGKTSAVFDDTELKGGAGDDDPSNPNDVNLTDNTWYGWRARATDGAHPGAWSDLQKVFYNPVNDAPTAPTLVSPLSGERVSSATPRLVIDNAADPDDAALSYRFELFDNEALAGTPVAAATVAGHASGSTRWTVPVTLRNHQAYTWRATAIDPQDGATPSIKSTFSVDLGNSSPGIPALSAPANDAVVAASSATLVVDNTSDADGDPISYWFEVDTSPAFSSPDRKTSSTLPAGSGGKTSWTVDGLKEDARYYWRARATDGVAASDWFVASFRVNATNGGPSVPIPLAPADGSLVASATPALTALGATDPEGDALTYDFEVRAETPDGAVVVSTSGVSSTAAQSAWTVSTALPAGKPLYWTVRANDGKGGVSEWAKPAQFLVSSGGGCGCGVPGDALAGGLLPLLGVVLGLARRRRRSR